MKKIIGNIANLIKVKTLITIVVTVVFAVLALRGTISPDNVMIIISMVVSFYFGTQHEKRAQRAYFEKRCTLNPLPGHIAWGGDFLLPFSLPK